MKKNIIFIITTIIFIMILFIPTQNALAAAKVDTSGISVSTSKQSEFDDAGKVILGAIQGAGIGISVIVLIVIGIKFMVGSVEEKAEYKESMKPYIIGVVFLALCTTIPNIIYKFVK